MTTTDHVLAIDVTARLLRTEHERRLVAERDLAAERLAHAAARRDLAAAIARAEAAERGAVAPTAAGDTTEDKANLAAYLAAWNARTDSQHLHGVRAVATAAVERHRLTPERLASALEAHGHGGLTRKVYAHLAPATVPPGLVEEVRTIIDRTAAWIPHAKKRGYVLQTWQDAMRETLKELRDALARHQPAPTAQEAPRYVVKHSPRYIGPGVARCMNERAATEYAAKCNADPSLFTPSPSESLAVMNGHAWAVVDTRAPPPAEAEGSGS